MQCGREHAGHEEEHEEKQRSGEAWGRDVCEGVQNMHV